MQPVSPADAKAHARVEFDTDDTLVDGLIEAAVQRLDGYAGILGRCLITQVWAQSYPGWAPCLRLPFPDVAVSSLGYLDAAGVARTVPADQYEVSEEARGAEITFRDAFTRPALDPDRRYPVTVTFAAGYGPDPADVPAPIRAAILMQVAHLYEHREAVVETNKTELPLGVQCLVAPYRRVGP